MSDLAPHPIKLRWFLWTVLGLALFVLVGIYSVKMTEHYTSFDEKRAAARYDNLAKLKADEQTQLTTAAWIDQGKKIVRIPIDEAMAQEVDVLKAKPAAMGSAIPLMNAAPAASSSNASTASNAAPASSSSNDSTSSNAAPAKPIP